MLTFQYKSVKYYNISVVVTMTDVGWGGGDAVVVSTTDVGWGAKMLPHIFVIIIMLL